MTQLHGFFKKVYYPEKNERRVHGGNNLRGPISRGSEYFFVEKEK